MRRLLAIFTCGMVLCLSRGALAQDDCAEPPAPKPVDGAALREDQMRAAAAAARNFIAQSDVYQTCLLNALEEARAQALATGKPLDPHLEQSLRAKGAANQKLKEKVGAEINAAIGVYKRAHLK